MLKLIPQEKPENNTCKSKNGSQKNRRKNKTLAPKLRQKFEYEMKNEKNILHTICIKMVNFVKNEKAHTCDDVSELIHGLQKSILSLQRQRQKMVWHEQKKRKRGTS